MDLAVVEGVEGYWHYHLTSNGKHTRALCGAQTMVTSVQVSAWGSVGHLNEKWCKECADKAGL